MSAPIRVCDLCAAMSRAGVEFMSIEVEDGRVSLLARRADCIAAGCHGCAEMSVSGIAVDLPDDLSEVLLCKLAKPKTAVTSAEEAAL